MQKNKSYHHTYKNVHWFDQKKLYLLQRLRIIPFEGFSAIRI